MTGKSIKETGQPSGTTQTHECITVCPTVWCEYILLYSASSFQSNSMVYTRKLLYLATSASNASLYVVADERGGK